MSTKLIYTIALGSNLGDRSAVLRRAVSEIDSTVGGVIRRSRVYETRPVLRSGRLGPREHSFLNAVLVAESELPPFEVLRVLHEIEQLLGRVRSRPASRWAPRVLDLDLIAAGELVVNEPGITVPHPEMHLRDFVLEPMLDINPEWRHPLLDKTVLELHSELTQQTILNCTPASIFWHQTIPDIEKAAGHAGVMGPDYTSTL